VYMRSVRRGRRRGGTLPDQTGLSTWLVRTPPCCTV
jgi:hypothetical protein